MFVTLSQAEQIVEEMLKHEVSSYRVKICPENRSLIEELQASVDLSNLIYGILLTWTVIGVVTGETAYFIIHCKQPSQSDGKVIHVNFRAKKVSKRAA